MDAKKLEFLTGKTIVAVYNEQDVLEIVVKGSKEDLCDIYRFRNNPLEHTLCCSQVLPISKSFLLQRDMDRTLGIEVDVPLNTVCYSN